MNKNSFFVIIVLLLICFAFVFISYKMNEKNKAKNNMLESNEYINTIDNEIKNEEYM